MHECPERPRTKSGVKLAGKVVQLGSRCRCAGGWKGSRVVHRSFSRVVSGRHTAEARSKPFRLCCLFLGSFLRPLLPPPPSKASGFEISNAVAEILLSFQSFLADAERMRSLPKVGRGQRGMPRRVFGTKVVFPRHGRVWPASKFRMSFL